MKSKILRRGKSVMNKIIMRFISFLLHSFKLDYILVEKNEPIKVDIIRSEKKVNKIQASMSLPPNFVQNRMKYKLDPVPKGMLTYQIAKHLEESGLIKYSIEIAPFKTFSDYIGEHILKAEIEIVK